MTVGFPKFELSQLERYLLLPVMAACTRYPGRKKDFWILWDLFYILPLFFTCDLGKINGPRLAYLYLCQIGRVG
jgi:hypothetical protein